MMIGVYGGTFDPIHYGHLRTAVEVREVLGMDELRLVPCGTPAHRTRPCASVAQRRRMIELALDEADPGLCLDDRELRRDGPSFMVDTLQSMRNEYPLASLCLVVGADAFRGLERWDRWERLFDLAHIVVMGRPQTTDAELHPVLAERVEPRVVTAPRELRAGLAGCVYFAAVTQLAISASHIRDLIGARKNARYLLPGPVLDFVESERLYRRPRGSGGTPDLISSPD